MPHNQIVSRADSVLLVIDYQEKLVAAFKDSESFISSAVKLIKFCRILNVPIIWTEQYPQGLGRTVDQIGAELSELRPVEKTSFSCFGNDSFLNILAAMRRKQLLVCGIETHICVEQTVLDSLAADYQPHVVVDACASRKKMDHKTGLRKMENAGAVVSCVEMVMYEILKTSEAPDFRQVLRLVK